MQQTLTFNEGSFFSQIYTIDLFVSLACTYYIGPVFYAIYSLVNSIMCIPCLYGYASVIFNNKVFSPHINALSKLVLWSSTIHQFSFTIFSSLPFSIGQVQDAGLIFLSQMANVIANELTDQGATTEEILSTTLVLLSLATASLGVICIVMGKLKLADAVAYLPLPVVGGYLAFIGYFCIQAGISLCISKPMIGIAGWTALWSVEALILAIPGITAGAFLVWIARNVQHDVALPLAMVCIPAGFYLLLFMCGGSLEGAREGGKQ
jgi:MFS superfamily sulfate permease-like transporter